MKRYVALLNSDGYQAGLQLATNPEQTINKLKQNDKTILEKRAKIIYCFETGEEPTDGWKVTKYVNEYINKHRNKIVTDDDSTSLAAYSGYELRKRFVGGSNIVEAFYGVTESDHEKIMHNNGYEIAFHILDICITGKTRLNRFNNKKEEVITGVNLTKDFSKKKNEFKKLRKIMYMHLQDEEDDDEI